MKRSKIVVKQDVWDIENRSLCNADREALLAMVYAMENLAKAKWEKDGKNAKVSLVFRDKDGVKGTKIRDMADYYISQNSNESAESEEQKNTVTYVMDDTARMLIQKLLKAQGYETGAIIR